MSPIDQLVSLFNQLFSSDLAYCQAFVAGLVGSIAYYTSLRLGFVGGDQRDSILNLFGSGYGLIAWFSVIGGSVATIFQLAQGGTFAPIQGFVLGITWPILVGQYVAGAKNASAEAYMKKILTLGA